MKKSEYVSLILFSIIIVFGMTLVTRHFASNSLLYLIIWALISIVLQGTLIWIIVKTYQRRSAGKDDQNQKNK